jgi:hypothetical protein
MAAGKREEGERVSGFFIRPGADDKKIAGLTL